MMRHNFIFFICFVIGICKGSFNIQDNTLLSKFQTLEDELDHLKDDLTSYNQKKDESKFQFKDYASTEKREDNPSYRYSCGFESDCSKDFKIADTTPLKWSNILMYGVNDRTEPFGHYMYAEITKNNKKDEYAHFSHEFTTRGPEQCGEFYFHMYNRDGCDVARLLVTLECEGSAQSEILLRETGRRHNKWHRVAMDIKKAQGSKCKLTWRVSKGLTDAGKVYIDDISMYYGACRDQQAPAHPSQASCAFAYGSCEWKESGILSWKPNSWGTKTKGTGPDRYYPEIHATRTSGKYIYLEADDSNAQGKSAMITSPKVKSPIDQCMRFAYHMYGKDMGSLEAISYINNQAKQELKKSGDQGNQWHEGWVELPANKEIQVKIEATVGNGVLSDIALGSISVQPGKCSSKQVLGDCESDRSQCSITDDVCGEEIKEFTHAEAFQLKQNHLLTTIPKMAKEWELSLQINLKTRTNGWTSIIRMTNTGADCCTRGDRIPAIFVYSNSNKMHITNTIDNNGNYAYNSASLSYNKFTTVKLQQKKDSTGKYYYYIYVNGGLRKKQENKTPVEWRNVKLFTSDDFFNAADAEVKNIVFKNTGDFDACKPICNKPLSDPAFLNLKPDAPKTYAAALTPVKNTLKDTIPLMAKEWSLSLEIKPKGTVRGWANIIHLTATGKNCCGRGDRVPGIWFHSRSTRMHICSQVDWAGNRCKDTDAIPLNTYTKVLIKQVKVGVKYEYTVDVAGKNIYKVDNPRPTEWKNVKMYTSDPWHNPANVEIKNVEFKNLVPVYPCPNLCKSKEVDSTIEGVQVKAVSFKSDQCDNKPYVYQVKVPSTVRTPRLSCLKFYYKLGEPKKKSLYCRFDVYYQQHRLMNLNTYKQDEWIKVELTVKHYIPYGPNRVVGVRYYMHDRCSDIMFAKMELTDGICDSA